MATIEDLRAFGANVDEGVQRCVNNADFYLKMVKKAADDTSFEDLEAAVNEKNLDQAFELAHALKGALANLALTPLHEPVSQMVEQLRNRTDMDYSPYLETIRVKKDELRNLMQ